MAFTCPCCQRTSHNPHDEEQGYCGACHWWTADPVLGPAHLVGDCPLRREPGPGVGPICERCGNRPYVFIQWEMLLCPECLITEGLSRASPRSRDRSPGS